MAPLAETSAMTLLPDLDNITMTRMVSEVGGVVDTGAINLQVGISVICDDAWGMSNSVANHQEFFWKHPEF